MEQLGQAFWQRRHLDSTVVVMLLPPVLQHMGLSKVPLTTGQLISPRVSEPGEGESSQNGNHSVLYHHLSCTLLVTQTNPDGMWEGTIRVLISGDRDHQEPPRRLTTT